MSDRTGEQRSGGVIFLDIDGVLAIRPQAPRAWKQPALIRRGMRLAALPVAPQPRLARRLMAGCISCLNVIAEQSQAVLVMSSSWLLRGDVRPQLRAAGVAAPFHEDWRTDDGPECRGDQIIRWLAAHGRPPYIVIDDWPQGIEAHEESTVLIDYRFGLQPHHVEPAVRRLHEQGDGLR